MDAMDIMARTGGIHVVGVKHAHAVAAPVLTAAIFSIAHLALYAFVMLTASLFRLLAYTAFRRVQQSAPPWLVTAELVFFVAH